MTQNETPAGPTVLALLWGTGYTREVRSGFRISGGHG